MHLKFLSLQNFRTYTKSNFNFSPQTTFIVGPNTAGKTNLMESLYMLSFGKSFRAQKDAEVIQFGSEFARVSGLVGDEKLEVFLSSGVVGTIKTAQRRYLVNGVGKRRVDFMGHFLCVLFSPSDLDLISGSPSLRREFLNEALEATDRTYRVAFIEYTKALKQRNSLLHRARETGIRNKSQFEYWDEIIIRAGQEITKKREEFIEFLNTEQKEVFDCSIVYDPSTISKDRLLQYEQAEMDSGVTLVGPHRDDFVVSMDIGKQKDKNVALYGSRGQQRLVVLQLKLLEIAFIEQKVQIRPAFLLDDVFSELDSNHIELVLKKTGQQQTIITTTHKEFVTEYITADTGVIELGR